MNQFVQLAMVVPNSECVYTPSRIATEPVALPDNSPLRRGWVSFAPDGVSDPVELDLYGCWYIKLEHALAHGWQAVYVLELPMVTLSVAGFEVVVNG